MDLVKTFHFFIREMIIHQIHIFATKFKEIVVVNFGSEFHEV